MSSNHQLIRKPTYAKRLIALGTIVTLSLSAIFANVLWEMRRRDRQEALDAATNLVSTIGIDISRNIELYDLSLQGVIDGLKLPDIDGLRSEVRRMVLFDRAATAKGLGGILVIDAVGMVAIDSQLADFPATSHSHRDFFLVHQQRDNVGLYISRPWVTSDGEHVMSLSRRISNPDGSFAGVVAGTIRLS